MRFLDFSSWQGVLTTVGGLLLVTLIGVGIRVLMMLTIQQRQQRMNRQINERLRSLIAAYKVLGGSFTGSLTVDPTHIRDLRAQAEALGQAFIPPPSGGIGDRNRQMRDAVEAALADIILLGTPDQVRMAADAAARMVAGDPLATGELVISLRDYIREALDLGPIPADVPIPSQGPSRPQSGGRGAGARGEGGRGSGGGSGGGDAGGGGTMGGGMGMGMGAMGMGRGNDPL